MDAIFASTYEPMSTIFRRPSLDSLSQASAFSSTPSSPRPASPSDDSDSTSEARMDEALAKETMGLPIFVSVAAPSKNLTSKIQNATVSVARPTASSSTSSQSVSTESNETAGNRLSQLFSVARNSLDSLVRKSATFLLEEADDSALVIEWRWERPAAAREQQHDSNEDGNALLDKDGWVEGWLD
ncbi:hypothetical protein K461DRAFT_280167 [Myriangium duriaei CBS 260.36]|uniref:Uncharacterized protein n=1 Tax=Myriangium duriaei CBS 260.36 TaxID=1168546 RepID=A0A9P4MFP9_9PEZI|nr:hypothetical protein K461DRAFT_280167 [Myriangium duriaei CBS 260.36]